MGLLDKLKAVASEGLGKVRKFTDPITEKSYLEAAMAVGFLVGGADGDFDADERAGVVDLIKQDATLSSFDDAAISAAFSKVEDMFKITLPLGRKNSLKLVSAITDPAQKEALMEFACVISTLDGDVGDDERAMLDKISAALGVPVDEDLLEV